jgi:hypothetical protein
MLRTNPFSAVGVKSLEKQGDGGADSFGPPCGGLWEAQESQHEVDL